MNCFLLAEEYVEVLVRSTPPPSPLPDRSGEGEGGRYHGAGCGGRGPGHGVRDVAEGGGYSW